MQDISGRTVLRAILMTSVSAVAMSLGSVALAQDAPPADGDQASTDKVEKVTVTGTRLKKDEFTSPSPVQIVNPEKAEKAGSIDLAGTIQGASIAQGSSQITSAISSAF